jgi:hypothetical protein
MPESFAPSPESTDHFEQTLKLQIHQAVVKHISKSREAKYSFQRHSPPVQPLYPELPNITMLKLVVASNNLVQGVGKVFTGIIQQTGLTPEEFHSRLQIIEGDLGSCNIFKSLRNQRTPSRSYKGSLHNVLPIPGASHTLWNISQSIFLYYWGEKTHSQDTEAWQTMHALGIPANKPVTKKDLNLMLSHIEKIHEATLVYCAL